MEERLRTEWAKLDHVLIVAAIRQCHCIIIQKKFGLVGGDPLLDAFADGN